MPPSKAESINREKDALYIKNIVHQRFILIRKCHFEGDRQKCLKKLYISMYVHISPTNFFKEKSPYNENNIK